MKSIIDEYVLKNFKYAALALGIGAAGLFAAQDVDTVNVKTPAGNITIEQPEKPRKEKAVKDEADEKSAGETLKGAKTQGKTECYLDSAATENLTDVVESIRNNIDPKYEPRLDTLNEQLNALNRPETEETKRLEAKKAERLAAKTKTVLMYEGLKDRVRAVSDNLERVKNQYKTATNSALRNKPLGVFWIRKSFQAANDTSFSLPEGYVPPTDTFENLTAAQKAELKYNSTDKRNTMKMQESKRGDYLNNKVKLDDKFGSGTTDVMKKKLAERIAALETEKTTAAGLMDTEVKSLEDSLTEAYKTASIKLAEQIKAKRAELAEVYRTMTLDFINSAIGDKRMDIRLNLVSAAEATMNMIHENVSTLDDNITKINLRKWKDDPCSMPNSKLERLVPPEESAGYFKGFWKTLFSTTLTDTARGANAVLYGQGTTSKDDASKNIRVGYTDAEYGLVTRLQAAKRLDIGVLFEGGAYSRDFVHTVADWPLMSKTNTKTRLAVTAAVPVNDVLRVMAEAGYEGYVEHIEDLIEGSKSEDRSTAPYVGLRALMGWNKGIGDHSGTIEAGIRKSIGMKGYDPELDSWSNGYDMNSLEWFVMANSPSMKNLVEAIRKARDKGPIENEYLANLLGELFTQASVKRSVLENKNTDDRHEELDVKAGLVVGVPLGKYLTLQLGGSAHRNFRTYFLSKDGKPGKSDYGKLYFGIIAHPKDK